VSTNNNPLLQRVQSSYQRLTSVASNLNAVSDELGRAISALDESLKKLNLGITCWHKFDGNEHESGTFWAKHIGYSKVGNKWGIGLSKTSGHQEAPPEYNTDEEWLFNDAPRELRLEAVEHIPAMIETLIKAGEEAVEKVRVKTAEAQQLAEVLASPSKPVPRNTQSR
jgi:prefoldin subunit 5